jgi:general secretion pathway protein G
MLQQIRKAMKEEKGFTLIELLIVIVILGVLAAIVVFSVSGITDRGKTSACKADVATVTSAVEAYYAATPAAGTPAYPADEAAATTALVPKFLHSWPADVDYTWTAATGPTVVGNPAC